MSIFKKKAAKPAKIKEPKKKVPARITETAEVPVQAPVAEVDYLRKFQYKKINGGPVWGKPETDPSQGSKAERMKKLLLKQPKVRIIIPRAEGESPVVKLSVNLNGYRLDLPKQTYIEVPEQIAEVIMNSQHQTEEALQFMRIDREKPGLEEAMSR